MGDPIVDKHILDIIARNPSSDVEVSQVKIKGNQKKVAKKVVKKKTKIVKKAKSKTLTKKVVHEKHVKYLKKKVKEMHVSQNKHVTAIKKEVKKTHNELKKQLKEVHKTVEEGKNIYVPEPRPSLENQMIIESMNKLTAVVKQLVVLFNHKVTREDGPLFTKLNEIVEQNEKIAEGILAVADLVQDTKTEPAQIKPINPYQPRIGPMPQQVRPQQSMPQEMQQMPPPDFGAYQEAAEQQGPDAGQQPFMGPVPQYTAPLPPMSSPEEKPVGPKRMLF